MLDHIGIGVSEYAASKQFYEAALSPLGYTVLMEFGEACGLGASGKPDFWIGKSDKLMPVHVAFACTTRAPVDAFYSAAMAAGATDNGAPGLRAHYHPNYYGAFVLDPDGNNIEAVCHLAPGAAARSGGAAKKAGKAKKAAQAKKATKAKPAVKKAATKKAPAKKKKKK